MKDDLYTFWQILKMSLILGFIPMMGIGILIVTAYKALRGDFYEEADETTSTDKNKVLPALSRLWSACRRHMLAMPVRLVQMVSAQISKVKPFFKRHRKESVL